MTDAHQTPHPTSPQTPDATSQAVIVTALLVAAFLLVGLVLNAITSMLSTFAYGGGYSFISTVGQGLAAQVFTLVLPVAVGVYVGFRIVAPITAGLRLKSVLVRSLVASAIAAVLAFAVGFVLILGTTVTDNIFGNSFPLGQFGGAIGRAFGSLGTTVSIFFGNAPLIALAAVLLWLWLGAKRRAASV